MEEKHFIEWIELVTNGKVYRQALKPGQTPETVFNLSAEQVSAPPSIVASSRSEELPITRGIPGLMAVLGACLGLVVVAIIHVEIDKGKGPAEP